MYFAESTISILSGGTAFKKTYLLSEEYKEIDRGYFILSSGGQTVEVDDIDYKIMNELAIKARTPLIELAEILNISSQSVSYRIKNLIKNGVILALRTNINNEKLGLQNTCLDINLKNHSKKK